MIVLSVVMGCGKKDKSPTGPGGPTGIAVPFSDGVWIEQTQVTYASGDEACYDFEDSFTDTFVVSQGRVTDATLSGCSLSGSGGNFTISCNQSEPAYGTCVVQLQWNGTGTYDATSFTSQGTVTISSTGDCNAFPIPACVMNITVTGTKAPVSPTVGRSRPGLRTDPRRSSVLERLHLEVRRLTRVPS